MASKDQLSSIRISALAYDALEERRHDLFAILTGSPHLLPGTLPAGDLFVSMQSPLSSFDANSHCSELYVELLAAANTKYDEGIYRCEPNPVNLELGSPIRRKLVEFEYIVEELAKRLRAASVRGRAHEKPSILFGAKVPATTAEITSIVKQYWTSGAGAGRSQPEAVKQLLSDHESESVPQLY